jgi:hypothetical protein
MGLHLRLCALLALLIALKSVKGENESSRGLPTALGRVAVRRVCRAVSNLHPPFLAPVPTCRRHPLVSSDHARLARLASTAGRSFWG